MNGTDRAGRLRFRATIPKRNAQSNSGIGTPEVFFVADKEEARNRVKELALGFGLKTYRVVDKNAQDPASRGLAEPPRELTGIGRGEAMTEWNKIAAAILACEASRQQQEMVKSGPGKTPATRDVAGELWSHFEAFLERLERDRTRGG